MSTYFCALYLALPYIICAAVMARSVIFGDVI
jgi:hypothetical protein